VSRTIEDIFDLLERHDGKNISAHAMGGFLLRHFAEILSNVGDRKRHAGREPYNLACEWHAIARPLYTDVADFNISAEAPDALIEAHADGVDLSEWIRCRCKEQPEGMLAAKINVHATVLMLCSLNQEGRRPDDPADLSSDDAVRVIKFIHEMICAQIPAVDLLGALADGE